MNNKIMPNRDRIQSIDNDYYIEWTQEQKQLVRDYIFENGFQRNRGTLDGGRSSIIISGKHYTIIYSTKYIGYPCDVRKADLSDHKPNWQEIRNRKQEEYLQWQKQNPDAPFKRYN